MTPRSFWIILFRILGLFIIVNSITQIPTLIPILGGIDADSVLYLAMMLILLVAILYLVYHYLIVNNLKIIDILGLDKGFTEDIFQLNLNGNSVIQLAVVFIGGLVLIQNVPLVINSIFTNVKITDYSVDYDSSAGFIWPIYNICMSIVGYIFIRYYKPISAKIQSHIDNETSIN